ncbi:MAG: homoprotocatechuate degradation operon regulator HpaR [Bosea sp.]|uniref:homoprotocatechuate degradation operon regulator HpaR n=1 Tax=Bosea sp. (in: a-proteobacteria) TaxID=1871050 RepID=UPI0023A5CFA5|nr:homoprotocatechuate degradation operon regulator HpaR [Bosea sp. (in: a-proteobacteria)]MCP4736818.1 homoprotocatechuate degradation operon regulator HpaR [Bosea sp. (in: a-proteobacteria)]
MSLLRARESVMRHFRKSLREFGVTEQQWRVLRALSTKPQMEVAELARATFLLGPSLSRILVDLDQRGLILREPDPADLRRWMISLSPSGSALIDNVTPVSEAIYREISQRFGEDRLSQLQDLLAELEEAMAGLGNDGPDAPAD